MKAFIIFYLIVSVCVVFWSINRTRHAPMEKDEDAEDTKDLDNKEDEHADK